VGQGYWIAQPLEPDAVGAWEQEFAEQWQAVGADSS
jgi:hypothetical protein